jgi:hypothetical protein
VEGAPLGLMERILGYIMDERAALRVDMAGRTAAAELEGLTRVDAGLTGGAEGRGAASEFQRKLTPFDAMVLVSDLFGGKGEPQQQQQQPQPVMVAGRTAKPPAATSPLGAQEMSAMTTEGSAVFDAIGIHAERLDAAAAAGRGDQALSP